MRFGVFGHVMHMRLVDHLDVVGGQLSLQLVSDGRLDGPRARLRVCGDAVRARHLPSETRAHITWNGRRTDADWCWNDSQPDLQHRRFGHVQLGYEPSYDIWRHAHVRRSTGYVRCVETRAIAYDRRRFQGRCVICVGCVLSLFDLPTVGLVVVAVTRPFRILCNVLLSILWHHVLKDIFVYVDKWNIILIYSLL